MNKKSRFVRWLAAKVPYLWILTGALHIPIANRMIDQSWLSGALGFALAGVCTLLGFAMLAQAQDAKAAKAAEQPEVHP